MPELSYTDREVRRVKRRQSIRVFVFTVLVGAVALLVADNTDDVTIGWLFDETEMPLIVALLGTWAAGLVTGLLIAWHVQARPSRQPPAPAAIDLTAPTGAAENAGTEELVGSDQDAPPGRHQPA